MPSTPKSPSTRTASDFMPVLNPVGGVAPARATWCKRCKPGCNRRRASVVTERSTEQRRSSMSEKAEQKSFAAPDETRAFDYGALDLL